MSLAKTAAEKTAKTPNQRKYSASLHQAAAGLAGMSNRGDKNDAVRHLRGLANPKKRIPTFGPDRMSARTLGISKLRSTLNPRTGRL